MSRPSHRFMEVACTHGGISQRWSPAPGRIREMRKKNTETQRHKRPHLKLFYCARLCLCVFFAARSILSQGSIAADNDKDICRTMFQIAERRLLIAEPREMKR